METIGLIYEITGNPYFGINENEEYSNKISEYVYPSEINDICVAIENLGFEYKIIDGPKGLLNDVLSGQKCDLYFNKSIGFKGLERKIAVPAISQLYKLPIIGSNAYAMTLARHKYHTNRLLSGMGLKVPYSIIVKDVNLIPKIKLFPVIVKPNEESDSLGISENSICYNVNEVIENVILLFNNFKQPVIIEQFISGEEWKIAVIGNNENTHSYGGVNSLKNGITMKGTLQTRNDILDNLLTYSPISKCKLFTKALRKAEQVHNLLGLNDYSRCDFRIGEDNELYCMEVSTHPFLVNSIKDSSFIYAAMQQLLDYNSIIKKIIEASKIRNNMQYS